MQVCRYQVATVAIVGKTNLKGKKELRKKKCENISRECIRKIERKSGTSFRRCAQVSREKTTAETAETHRSLIFFCFVYTINYDLRRQRLSESTSLGQCTLSMAKKNWVQFSFFFCCLTCCRCLVSVTSHSAQQTMFFLLLVFLSLQFFFSLH